MKRLPERVFRLQTAARQALARPQAGPTGKPALMNVEPTSLPTTGTPHASSDAPGGERASHEEVSAMKRMPNGNGGGGP